VATTSIFNVSLLTPKVIGWICCVVFIGASVGAFLAGQLGPAYGFLIFVLLGVFLIAIAGSIGVGEKPSNIRTSSVITESRGQMFPSGHLNFLHPWPGQTPPPGDGGTRDDYAV
jgi:uncharacterized membrane protein YfcA